MSGHSRWAQVKHKKAGADAKRGALFSKLARLISMAAREGGSDPDMNPKLRQAIEQARDAGVPKDNIERAIQRARGSQEVENIHAVEYEAYGPANVALLISGLTDNPNRTTNEIKQLFQERGGRLADVGSVAWMFDRRIIVETDVLPDGMEATELALIDAGAEVTSSSEGRVRALVPPEGMNRFTRVIVERGLHLLQSRLTAVPKHSVAVSGDDVHLLSALTEALEDHPDIVDVWSNARAE